MVSAFGLARFESSNSTTAICPAFIASERGVCPWIGALGSNPDLRSVSILIQAPAVQGSNKHLLARIHPGVQGEHRTQQEEEELHRPKNTTGPEGAQKGSLIRQLTTRCAWLRIFAAGDGRLGRCQPCDRTR